MTEDNGMTLPPSKPHPRTIGWMGTAALALGGCNNLIFLLPTLFAGFNAASEYGLASRAGDANTISIALFIIGIFVTFASIPGWLELVMMSPGKVGGIAAACTEAFRPYSPMVSALTGVCYWWGWVPSAGFTAYILATTIQEWCLPGVPIAVTLFTLIAVLCGINLMGIRWVTRLALPFACATMMLAFVSMLAPILAGTVDWHRATDFHLKLPFDGPFGIFSGLMSSFLAISFSVPSIEVVLCHVGETRDWRRKVPRAMLAAATMMVVFSGILPLVWLGVLGPVALDQELSHVLGPVFAPLLGAFGKSAAIGFMMLNSFHFALVPFSGAARALAQLSEDGLLPRVFGRRLSSSDAPWVTTLLTAAMVALFLLMGEPIWLEAGATLNYAIGISLPSIAVWLLRRDAPEAERPWRAPRFTIGLGVMAAIFWMLCTLFGLQQIGLPSVVVALVFALSAYGLYAWRQIEDTPQKGWTRLRDSLHFKLTAAMLSVFALDATGYLLAVNRITHADPADIALLGDIFTVVAAMTIAVGIVMPSLIAHTVTEVSAAAHRLATGTIRDFTLAMDALGRGDLDHAHVCFEVVPVAERGTDELGMMARAFNVLQHEVKRASLGLDQAREGLHIAREELIVANQALRQTVAEQERLTGQLAEAKEIAQHDALHDPLTGLPNRKQFLDRLEAAFARHRADPAEDSAVLFIDLDRFKIVNDSLGHQAGDLLLQQVAARLCALLPEAGDMAARLSGDEFTLLLTGRTDPEALAADLLRSLGEPFPLDVDIAYIGASIGIVASLAGYDDTETLLRDADIAMYRAKRLGKGRALVFEPAMHAQVETRLHVENDLRQAIDNREFELHYQPVLELPSETIDGLEALVRWRTPRGLIGPDAFIGIAEETGLILPLGDWIFREACRMGAHWHRAMTGRPVRIGINISARQFAEEDLVARIEAALADTGIDPTTIAIEITESATMHDSEWTVQVLTRLKAIGMRISVDDFGTGYSSLSYLHRFPIDTMKIDRSFVSDLATNPASQKMVTALLALAKSMGIKTIAEGIETQTQFDLLKQLGCTYMQGFLIARPMPAGDIERLLYPGSAPSTLRQPQQPGGKIVGAVVDMGLEAIGRGPAIGRLDP